MGARASSNSWGYCIPNIYEPTLKGGIQYAIDEYHMMIVFANGNHNSNEAYYPGSFDNIIIIAVTHKNGSRAHFSIPGDWINIAAPGTEILSTGNCQDGQSTYVTFGGTSMAVPQVSVILALGRKVRPYVTGKQLRHCLLSTALELGDPDLGAGMIDPDGFLNCVHVLALSTDLPTQA